MRFLTFIKQQDADPADPELVAFKKWFLVSKIARNNPHAGLVQIELFMHLNDAPQAVINGFYKWRDDYQKQIR